MTNLKKKNQNSEGGSAATPAYLVELLEKLENEDDPEEKANKKDAASKSQGTKDGKNLSSIKPNWINFVGYRDNYEKNLKSVIDDGSAPEENKTKAKELLDILNERYKSDAREDMPNPKSAIDLKIVKPRFTSNEAYKKEYKKRGRNLIKRINESVTLDKEDKANIKIIEDYLKLFD